MMNNQEFFSKTVDHLRRQNKKATNGKLCTYRMEDPERSGHFLKCAIGVHIPDSLYRETMEGRNVFHLAKMPGMSDVFEGIDMKLLLAMQDIHDYSPIEDWEDKFHFIAQKYGLEIDEKQGA